MNFSYKYMTLRSGNLYGSSAQLEKHTHEEEMAREVEVDANEGKEDNSVRFSLDLIDEKIKASLEPLHAQIFARMEMMDRLIQSISAGELPMASTHETRCQYESPFSGAPKSSRFPTVAPLTTAGYFSTATLCQNARWKWLRK